jgi:hypothetical protein
VAVREGGPRENAASLSLLSFSYGQSDIR